MNRTFQGLLAVAAMATSFCANAQLVSSVVTDSSGLMWANNVGVDLYWNPDGAAGTAQGWVAGLNAEDYGGYSDGTLATVNVELRYVRSRIAPTGRSLFHPTFSTSPDSAAADRITPITR